MTDLNKEGIEVSPADSPITPEELSSAPSLGAIADGLTGKAPMGDVLGEDVKDKETLSSHLFTPAQGLQISEAVSDVTHALADTIINTAHSSNISKIAGGDPLMSIMELGSAVKVLMDLVDPSNQEVKLTND